ncbi:hypothetical protein GCM10010399_41680 [Dactylosporangium fulvum]|uniref:Uncharacterized protein n=1 Tax=Dactylosporangium fulvum TaxID=53359 RepID=A0ABY5VYX3_9ACTN|nr:hypothetical protein [Dactylosporangium fulvum]UWP82359.1 hypothetical protein Dfulv_46170 [Dactylosporangium fulvum]
MPDGTRIIPVHYQEGIAQIIPATGSASLHAAATADALAVLTADWRPGDLAPTLAIP